MIFFSPWRIAVLDCLLKSQFLNFSIFRSLCKKNLVTQHNQPKKQFVNISGEDLVQSLRFLWEKRELNLTRWCNILPRSGLYSTFSRFNSFIYIRMYRVNLFLHLVPILLPILHIGLTGYTGFLLAYFSCRDFNNATVN